MPIIRLQSNKYLDNLELPSLVVLGLKLRCLKENIQPESLSVKEVSEALNKYYDAIKFNLELCKHCLKSKNQI